MFPGNSKLPVVKVTDVEGKGRALVASQPLKAGQVVLRDSPILAYSAIPLKNGVMNCYCSNCFRKIDTSTLSSSILSCPSCSYHALFCSPECRSLALSSSHSPWVCQALNCIRYSSSLDAERRVEAYFLVAAYNLAVVSPSDFQILLSLQGESSPTPDAATLFLHSFISTLSPPHSFVGFSPELTAALLSKDKLNAFGLMEPFDENRERSVRAYGIYPKASLFNHDCLPNACRFDYVDSAASGNTDIIVRAIHDVPEGREICLSYFPVNESYVDRQNRLIEDYGFTCQCDRCKVEMNWLNDDCEESVEEGDDEQMVDPGNKVEGDNEDDFPHAYFFFRYMCTRNNCSGTLAPLPPAEHKSSSIMECNVCGQLKTEEEICVAEGENNIGLDE